MQYSPRLSPRRTVTLGAPPRRKPRPPRRAIGPSFPQSHPFPNAASPRLALQSALLTSSPPLPRCALPSSPSHAHLALSLDIVLLASALMCARAHSRPRSAPPPPSSSPDLLDLPLDHVLSRVPRSDQEGAVAQARRAQGSAVGKRFRRVHRQVLARLAARGGRLRRRRHPRLQCRNGPSQLQPERAGRRHGLPDHMHPLPPGHGRVQDAQCAPGRECGRHGYVLSWSSSSLSSSSLSS